MIKNDRQYRLSKAQLRAFESAISNLRHEAAPAGVDPGLPELERRAIESQLEELSSEVREYEALKAGRVTTFEAHSLDELPRLLVQARIARGMRHKELADRLSLKEQQIQRWESNDFSGASIDNLKAIADALGVVFTQRLFLPRAEVTAANFLLFLNRSGLSIDFVLKRVIPPQISEAFRSGSAGLREIVDTAATLAKVFGLRFRDLVELKAPQFDFSVIATTRFKLPARQTKAAVSGYALYANYLAALLPNCAKAEPRSALPSSSHDFYQAVTEPGKPMSFERVIRFLWGCGIIVLPLRDAGGFHGAVWKISDRFVIVLKQTTALESRWLYDVLHETGHIENGHLSDDSAILEDQEISPEATGAEEEAANNWAIDTLLDSRTDEIEEACTQACATKLERLKAVLPGVAERFNVNVGCLANHMAFRLAEQHLDWWGAAHNLQRGGEHPFEIARQTLLEHVSFSCLTNFDRELLSRALAEE